VSLNGIPRRTRRRCFFMDFPFPMEDDCDRRSATRAFSSCSRACEGAQRPGDGNQIRRTRGVVEGGAVPVMAQSTTEYEAWKVNGAMYGALINTGAAIIVWSARCATVVATRRTVS
jgi:hypothetical protein